MVWRRGPIFVAPTSIFVPPLDGGFWPPDDPHGLLSLAANAPLLCLVTKVTLCQYGGQSGSILSSSGLRKEY